MRTTSKMRSCETGLKLRMKADRLFNDFGAVRFQNRRTPPFCGRGVGFVGCGRSVWTLFPRNDRGLHHKVKVAICNANGPKRTCPFDTSGGKRPFAAGARRQNVNYESRHSNNHEPRVLSAPPQGRLEPIQKFACVARNLR